MVDVVKDLGIEHVEVYAVMTNSDLIEGRGRQYPKYYCESLATAQRLSKKQYIMGTDCPIKVVKLVRIGNSYYEPLTHISVQPPSTADLQKEALWEAQRVQEEKKKDLLNKLRGMGVTDDEIELLKT